MILNMNYFAAASTTIDAANKQQTVVVVLTSVGTVLILPFGLWSLYTSYRAKVRPVQIVNLLFCLTIFFFLAFQVFWNQVLNKC